jgi:drug/metabolite transporter (DMT)-like permease
MAGLGFFATFAVGHEATRLAQGMPVILVTRATACLALLALMLSLRLPLFPNKRQLPLLGLMGALDCVALICVLSAGKLPNAEFAAVAASTFGMITVVLAWWFLKEKMTPSQWAGVILVFSGIGYLAV